MQAIGMLMVEHRLIERMVALLKKELANEIDRHSANPAFIYAAVDFFKNYADRTHHGKEEDILFKELSARGLSPEHKKIMDELAEEHKVARENVRGLLEAAQRYDKGDLGAIEVIITHLKRLVALYPPHIEKEDKHFFIPVMEYFSDEEKQKMLEEFVEFDKRIIHEKYTGMVQQYEAR